MQRYLMPLFFAGRYPMLRVILTIVLASLVCCPGLAQHQQGCGIPVALADGWPIEAPENVGIDGRRLCGIEARLRASEANVHGIVIVRHGKLVFEQYFAGWDDPWGTPAGQFEFAATSKHDLRSVCKSVTSLLVGLAIDRKLIAGTEEKVIKFFPEIRGPRQHRVAGRQHCQLSLHVLGYQLE